MAGKRDRDQAGSYLEEYSDDLWIRRRLTMGPVIEAGRRWATDHGVDPGDELHFLTFLDEQCTGQLYEGLNCEPQFWAELLNVMQISKKFNYRSVHFRDLIRNQAVILANKQTIMKLNGAAKLCHSIVLSLDKLETWISDEFKLLLEPDNPNLQLEQIRLASRMLDEQGKQPLSALRIELKSLDTLSTSFGGLLNKQVLIWSQRIDKHSRMISSISLLLERMDNLESRISQLRPLVDAASSNPESESASSNGFDDSIDRCKGLFDDVILFHKRLFALLKRSSSKTAPGVYLWRALDGTSVNLLGPELLEAIEKLDNCRHILDELMRTLRLEFGRFYFICDIELLTVMVLNLRLITDSRSDASIRRLVCKIFNDSIASFVLDSSSQQVVGVLSSNDELVELSPEHYITMRKSVNYYSVEVIRVLNEVQRKIRRSLRDLLTKSLASNGRGLEIDWSLPVQIMDLAEQIRFCKEFEDRIGNEKKLDQLLALYQERFAKLIKGKEVTQISRGQSAAISLTVQFISRIDACRKIAHLNDWRWLNVARSYLTDQGAEVCIGAARFSYRFDYLSPHEDSAGSYKRLISTELTDRCILASAQSIGLFRLGACPSGPAGSGKTESVKALGRQLGCQVLVHNCDESNDSQSMERLIWGLAQTGLWGCLDEFNRLSDSCLSSVCGVLEQIQTAIGAGNSSVELVDGRLMPLDPTAAFFLTLNPVEAADGRRYQGRRRLPANLRYLFLPVVMARVQIAPIVEESLLSLNLVSSSGAKSIASRLTNFLERVVARKSPHGQWLCEWDLRLAMAIVKRLSLRSRPIDTQNLDGELSEAIEFEVGPRLRYDEIPIFMECLGAALDGYQSSSVEQPEITTKLRGQLETRAGVIILGPAKAGKSSIWRRLYSQLPHETISWSALNPQACAGNSLFGHHEDEKSKWIDGLLTVRVREALDMLANKNELKQFWLVLDGPIDPDWIEALNSVMDDNRVLTLSSGERLNFELSPTKSIKLILESDNLDFVSPATISRFGLVYRSNESDLQVKSATSNSVLIIETGSSPSYKLEQIHQVVRSNSETEKRCKFFDYICHEMSDASDLLDLMVHHSDRKDCFIFHNIDSITYNKWKVRSFMQFIQFMVAYEGFYDNNHRFRNLKATIVLVCVDAGNIEPRIGTGASIVRLTENLATNKLIVDSGDLVHKLQSSAPPIVSLVCKNIPVVESLLRDHPQVDLYEFRNSYEICRAMEEMEKAPLDREPPNKVPLFMLQETKIRLMDEKSVKRLMHSINRLNEQRIAKFIYLTHRIEGKFWLLVGESWILGETKSDDLILEEIIARKIPSLGDHQIKWLKNNLIPDGKVQETRSKIVHLVLDMIAHFRSRLASERSVLEGGLKRLSDFEKQLGQVESRCKQEERELNDEQESLGKKLEDLNLTMDQAAVQRDRLKTLMERHELKTQQVDVKRLELETELAVVRQKVDQSKAEVGEHLKPEALNEIRALRAPPTVVQDILEVLFTLLGKNDTSWSGIKAHLARSSLRDELTKYNFDRNLNDLLLREVCTKMKNREASFDLSKAQRASRAVVPILNWIKATVEFGKTLARLKPLSSRMKELEFEAEDMQKESQSIQFELSKYEAKIQSDREECEQIKGKLDKARTMAAKLKSQLDRARTALRNSDDQVSRWKLAFESIKQYLEGLRLLKLCTMMSYMAQSVHILGHHLGEWKTQLGLESSDEMLAKEILELLNTNQNEQGLMRAETSCSRLLQLIGIKLGLIFRVHDYPIIISTMSHEQVARSLATCGILCKLVDNINFVECSGSSLQWTRLADSYLSSADQLLVLELTSSSSLLDLIHYLDSLGSSPTRRIIIMGQVHDRLKLAHILPTVDLMVESSSQGEMRHSMVWAMLSHEEPELQSKLKSLMEEFIGKKRDTREAEMQLIERLAMSREKRHNDTSLDEDLIYALQELEEMNISLKDYLVKIKPLEDEISKKMAQIEGSSNLCVDFFLKNLADLNRVSRFYNVPFDRFTKLIIDGRSAKELARILQDAAQQVAESMRPDHRLTFLGKIAGSSDSRIECRSLRQIIGLLVDRNTGTRFKVGLLLHDPRESNPQLELDEILSRKEDVIGAKIYASEDLDKRLKNLIDNLVKSAAGRDIVIRIANAHLSAKWLSSNLNSLLANLLIAPDNRLIILLIGECNSLDDDLNFESVFIDSVDLRYWHDNSSMQLTTRFKLLKESLPIGRLANKKLEQIAEDLVLIHAICQESSKKELKLSDGRCVRWEASYVFDSDQLALGFRTLGKLSSGDLSTLREDIRSQLVNFIYGSRMETSKDDETLRWLIDEVLYNRVKSQFIM